MLMFLGPVAARVAASVEEEEEGVTDPLSPTVTVVLAVSESTDETRWTRRRESCRSASVWSSKGSRLERTVPEKRTGSYKGGHLC